MKAFGLACVLAACSPRAKSAEPPVAPPVAPRPPVTLACIPAGAARLTNVAADGKRVRYCIADSDHCFTIDPDVAEPTGFARTTGAAPAPTGAYVETTQPRIEVCTSIDCTSLTAKVLPNAVDIRAATTSDGAFAAFLFGGATRKAYVEIWDVEQAKKVTTIKPSRGRACGDLAMLGGTVLLACGSQGTLFSLAGKQVAEAGGKNFVFGSFVPVDANIWAFLDERGTRIAFQDVIRGNVVKTVETSGVFVIGGGTQGHPGESALVRLGDGRLVVVASAPALGSVAAVDPKTGVVELRQAPPCR